jgi:hypothetical protein
MNVGVERQWWLEFAGHSRCHRCSNSFPLSVNGVERQISKNRIVFSGHIPATVCSKYSIYPIGQTNLLVDVNLLGAVL